MADNKLAGGFDVDWAEDAPAGFDVDWAEDAPAPRAEPERGWLSNAGRGAASRATTVAANQAGFLEGLERDVSAKWQSFLVDMARRAEGDEFADNLAGQFTTHRKDVDETFYQPLDKARQITYGYRPATTTEDVKADPLRKALPWIAEQGVVSLPEMVGSLVALPVVASGKLGELADQRAENDGRANPGSMDLLAAAPFAGASVALDRFGARGALGLDDLGAQSFLGSVRRAATREASTEAMQEGLESVGTTAFTERGFSAPETFERMAFGALAGGAIGGGLHATTGAYGRSRPAAEPEPEPVTVAAPAPAPRAPVNLLALPDLRGQNPIDVAPNGYAAPRGEVSHLAPRDVPAAVPYPAGAQPDLFAQGPAAPPAREAVPVEAAASEPELDPNTANMFEAYPEAEVPARVGSDFRLSSVLQRLRAANADEAGHLPAVDKFTATLGTTLVSGLRTGDIQGLDAALTDLEERIGTSKISGATVDARLRAVAAARQIVGDHQAATVRGYADAARTRAPQPGVVVAQPAPGPVTEELMRARNEEAAARDAQQAAIAARQQEEAALREEGQLEEEVRAVENKDEQERARAAILKRVLDDPSTRNPTGRFIHLLRKNWIDDIGIRPEEAAALARKGDAIEAFKPADPNLFGEFRPEPNPSATAPEPELPAGQPTAEMFDGEGRPTKQATKQTTPQLIAEANRLVAKITGGKARKIAEEANMALQDGRTTIGVVREVVSLLQKRKFAAAQNLIGVVDKLTPADKGVSPRPSRRAPDFAETGEYEVTDAGETRRMFRDPENGWWYAADLPGVQTHHSQRVLGFTRTEAEQALIEKMRAERDTPPPAPPKGPGKTEPTKKLTRGEMLKAAVRKARAEREGTADAPADAYEAVHEKLNEAMAEKLIDAKTYQQFVQLVTQRNLPAADLNAMVDEVVGLDPDTEVDELQFDDDGMAPQAQRVSRRDVLRGGVAGAVTAAASPALARTPINPKSFAEAAKSGDLTAAVKWVSENSKSPLYRMVAAKMLRGGFGEVKFRVVDTRTASNAELLEFSYVAGMTYPVDADTDQLEVVLVHRPGNPKEDGLNEETLLHEAIHAYVAARYRGVSSYNAHNRGLLKVQQSADEAVDEFTKLWRQVSDMMEAQFPDLAESEVWAQEIVRSPDEMLVRVFTDPDAQKFLKGLDPQGKKVAADDSLWARFSRWVAKLFGVQPKDRSAFGQLLEAGYSILDRAALDKPDSSYARKVLDFQRQAMEAPRKTGMARRTPTVDALPEPVREPVKSVLHTLFDRAQTGLNMVVLTDQLADMAAKVLPAAQKFVQLDGERAALRDRVERNVENVLHKFEEKVAEGQRPLVNALLYESTLTGKWAFQPDWLKTQIEVDPELAQRYKALPPGAQSVVRAVFKHNHAVLQRKKAGVLATINTDYDALIADAKAKGADEEAKRLQADKTRALAKYQTLMALPENQPYAAIKRYGDHVVVGMSQAYLDAEKAGDVKAMEEMRSKEEHYFVDFAGTAGEAKAMAERIKRESGYAYADNFAKDASQFKGDLFVTFQRLTKMLPDDDTAGSRAIRRMATDLYLTSLAEASARKSELRRKKVALDRSKVDMMRAFATQGLADAQFISNMHNNGKVLDAIDEMRKQVRARVEGREHRQRFFNELMARHVAGMEQRPSRFADVVTRATSLWMLALSPAYYFQNATQPWMLSQPYMAGKHGYAKAAEALTKAYADLGPALKNVKLLDRIDPKSLPADVRDAMQTLTERGRLQFGVEQELGSWKTTGSGAAAKAWNAVDRGLRQLPQKLESINRVSTAMAAYRLEMSKSGDKQAATDYADLVVRLTHGNYDGSNAPRFMRNPLGRIATQFRKFQIMQAGLMIRLVKNSFDKGPEAVLARKSLGYITGHAALMGGAMGLPGAAAIWALVQAILPDDDEPDDLEYFLRSHLGDGAVADLLTKGAPQVAGVDLSGKLGMGQMLSPLPYADVDLSKEGGKNLVLALTGPFGGGVVPKVFDGLDQMQQGDFYKGLETLLPTGLGNAMKGLRSGTEGVTNRRGDQLLAPEDIGFAKSVLLGLGFTPAEVADQRFINRVAFEQEEAFDAKAAKIKKAFAEAETPDARATARDEWVELQSARAAQGFKRQPMSSLIRTERDQAKRERDTVAGAQYDRGNRGFVERTADLVDGK